MSAALFQRQATGGAVARAGFEYQDAFLLQNLPLWLSQSAFSHVVSELRGDVEVRYYRPGGGTWCVTYEAKKYVLTKPDFWKEVSDFLAMHEQASDEYVRFVLVCTDFKTELDPLINKLARLRGPADSLNADSNVRAAAEADIVQTIIALGQSEALARFVLGRVWFTKYTDTEVEGSFKSGLNRFLPELGDLRRSQEESLLGRYRELVACSTKGLVSRAMLEAALVDVLASSLDGWRTTPTEVRLLPQADAEFERLSLVVGDFNGPARGQLGDGRWRELRQQAEGLGQFIQGSRARRAVRFSAKQRMSLACLLGTAFSPTRDFTLVMDHNGESFDTNEHAKASGPFFSTSANPGASTASQGVVGIGFPLPCQQDVVRSLSALGLGEAPSVFIETSLPVTDMASLNLAVAEAKAAMFELRSTYRLDKLHLFVKAPSLFAMALGYRLNGVGAVQLYDWVDGAYAPTALLLA